MHEEHAEEDGGVPAHSVACMISPEPHSVVAGRPGDTPQRKPRGPSLFSLVRSRRFELLVRRAFTDSQYQAIMGELQINDVV